MHGKNLTKVCNAKEAVAANKHKGDLERHLLRNTVSYMVMFTQNAIVAKTTNQKKLNPGKIKLENCHGESREK